MKFKASDLKEILESVGLETAEMGENFKVNTFHRDYEENGDFKIIWTIQMMKCKK